MRLNLIPLSQTDLAWLEPPNYLKARYFSLGGVPAYYTSGNGDYCTTYNKANLELKIKLIGTLTMPYPNINLYPIGKYYTVLNIVDQGILTNNMDEMLDCDRPTAEIYKATLVDESGVHVHPYGCISTTTTFKFFGQTFYFPGPLSCTGVITSQGIKDIQKVCSTHQIGFPELDSTGLIIDKSDVVRCL